MMIQTLLRTIPFRLLRYKSNIRGIRIFGFSVTYFGALLLGGCALFEYNFDDLEKICKAESRIIVHDRVLWKEYVIGANKSYQELVNQSPEPFDRSVPDHADGFEQRFGAKLSENRADGAAVGEISRDDIYVLKDGKVVAQFVDYVLPASGISGGGVYACTGLFSNLYSLDRVSYE